MDYTAAICRVIGCEPGQIVATAPVEGDATLLSVLIDYGIGGLKEYHLTLDELCATQESEQAAEPPVVEPPRRRGRPRKSEAQQ